MQVLFELIAEIVFHVFFEAIAGAVSGLSHSPRSRSLRVLRGFGIGCFLAALLVVGLLIAGWFHVGWGALIVFGLSIVGILSGWICWAWGEDHSRDAA